MRMKILLCFAVLTGFVNGNGQGVRTTQIGGTNLYCIIDSATGKLVKPLKYDEVKEFSEGLAVVIINGKYGFINTRGVEVIPARYTYANSFKNGFAWVNKNKMRVIIDRSGKEIPTREFETVGDFYQGLAFVKSEGGKYGYVNTKGVVVIPHSFDDAGNFSAGFAPVKKGEQYAYINRSGAAVTKFLYSYATEFNKSYLPAAIVENGAGRHLLVVEKGKITKGFCEGRPLRFEDPESRNAEVITEVEASSLFAVDNRRGLGIYNYSMLGFELKPKYREIKTLYKDWKLVAYNSIGEHTDMFTKWGVVYNGKEIIYPYWDEISMDDAAIYAIRENERSVFNLQGTVLAEKCQDIGSFIDGFALFRKNNKIGIIDRQGTVVVPPKYDMISVDGFNDGLIAVNIGGWVGKNNKFSGGKWGVINKAGELKLPVEYDKISGIQKGLISAERNKLFGIVDSTGKIVLPFDYRYLGHPAELIVAVMHNKCGFVNRAGEVVIDFSYENAGNFCEGLAVVMKNNKCGYINKSGKEIIPFIFDEGFGFDKGYAIVKMGEKYHFVDKTGKILK